MKNHSLTFSLLLALSLSFSCKQAAQTESSNPTEPSEQIQGLATNGPETITRNMLQDQAGDIWFAAFDGVFRYDGTTFTQMTSEVSSNRFFSLLEDSKGNKWFGSVGGGVFRYDGKSFENFNQNNGLIGNEIVSIFEDSSGSIWFGANGGLSRYDGKAFQNFKLTPDALYEDSSVKPRINPGTEVAPNRVVLEVNAIMEDKQGTLWFATRGFTYRYDGSSFTPMLHDGKHFTNARHLIQDKSGTIWLGGQEGLWRFDGEDFTKLSNAFTGFIYEDRAGNIWISSETTDKTWALSRFDQKSLSQENPIAKIIQGKEGMIFGILEANDGEIWYGTLEGFRRFDPKAIPVL